MSNPSSARNDRVALDNLAIFLGEAYDWNGGDVCEYAANLIGATGRPHPGTLDGDEYRDAFRAYGATRERHVMMAERLAAERQAGEAADTYIETLEQALLSLGIDLDAPRIAALKAEWAESTGDNPDDYELSEDDWSVGLGDDGAAEISRLLDRKASR